MSGMENTNEFGYPSECTKCSHDNCELTITGGFYGGNTDFRLMLIGQDPTIRNKNRTVNSVLMLDNKGSQLYRWLSEIFGADTFEAITKYATNVVKCTFDKTPQNKSTLERFFKNCKGYLEKEITTFKPDLVLTFGEPAHQLFRTLLEPSSTEIEPKMKNALNGNFPEVSIKNTTFKYSPSLHIQTYRVANTYGSAVENFTNNLREYIKGKK